MGIVSGLLPAAAAVAGVLPSISINDVSVTEGDSGTTAAQFVVVRDLDAGGTVTVDWTTTSDTANPSDYAPDSGTVTFNEGELSQAVTVQVYGDTDGESDEVFYVDLSNPTNATLADDRGKCTITNDDELTPVTIVVPLGGRQSVDVYPDPDNEVLLVALGETLVTGVGYDVTISTVGDSWLSEAKLYLDGSDQDGSGFHLTPGDGDDFAGTESYSSPVIDLTDSGSADLPILDDGRLYVQLYEGFDDDPGGVDAVYEAGSTLTIEYLPSPIFSDGFESGDVSVWSSAIP